MDERARRIGENEALYRTMNDEVHGLNLHFEVLADPMSAMCECGRLSCSERIDLTAAEYEALRREPTHFAVRPGHEAPDVEDVIAHRSGYVVVAKRPGGPADLARRTDPRS